MSTVEEVLGLSDATPSEVEVLLPVHAMDVEMLNGSVMHLNIYPWGLGRFCQAQQVIIELLSMYQKTLGNKKLDELTADLSDDTALRLLNLLMPHLHSLLSITLAAKDTFEAAPKNLRIFVDELPIATAVKIGIVMLRQNWRHLKNVLSLTEVSSLRELTSVRQSNT